MQTMGKKSKKSCKGNPKSEGVIESSSGDTSASNKRTSGDDSSEIAKFEVGFDNFSSAIMSAMEDIFGRDLVASGQAGLQEILQEGKAEGIANCRSGHTNLPKNSDSHQKSLIHKSAQIDAIQKVVLESLIPGGGWVPRHTFDPMMVMDFHAWCVDENGLIHDYPDHQLIQGQYGTRDVVRRPWDVNIVIAAMPHIEHMTKVEFFDKNKHVSTEQFLFMIKNNTFPKDNCYPRAKLLRDSDPTRYALVLGSLGYRQANGRVFWECG